MQTGLKIQSSLAYRLLLSLARLVRNLATEKNKSSQGPPQI